MFSEEEQTLMPYIICLTIAFFIIAVSIIFIIFKQQHEGSENQHPHLPNFSGNKIYNEDACTANNQKTDNLKRARSLVDQKSVDEDAYEGNTQKPDNIYKEFEKNIACSLPFKKNFEKNDLNASQNNKAMHSEQELIV